jgi:hypothetical protein
MGQYYKAVSLDAKQFVSPFGAKLMEHSWVGHTYMKRVENLLSPGNPWHKTQLVWAGDYGDKLLFTDDPDRNLYDVALDEFTNVSEGVMDGPEIRYIVNHSKNVYIDMEEVPGLPELNGEGDWRIHPLSILTSSGNGRGGGDYRDDDDTNVGSWAGDVISTEFLEPEGMEKYTAFFTED